MPSRRTFPRALTAAAAALALATITVPAANAALNPSFTEPAPASGSSTTSGNIQIASYGGSVTVIWNENEGSDAVLMASTLSSPGGNWSSPARISDPSEHIDGGSQQIVADSDGDLTVLWRVSSNTLKTRTWLRGSPAWSETQTLASEPGVSGIDLATGPDGTVVAAWASYHTGNSIRMRTRAASSSDWGTTVDVDENTDSPQEPRLAFNTAGDGIVVWSVTPDGLSTKEIRAARYTHADGTWSTAAVVSTDVQADNPNLNVALAPDGTATATWADTSFRVVASSAASGSSVWDAPDTLTAPGKVGMLGDVASDRSGNVVATFQEATFDPDFVVMYGASRQIIRTRSAATGDWSDSEFVMADQFGGGARMTVDREYNIAVSMLSADTLNASRLADGAIPGINVAVAYRPDGADSFTDADNVFSGDVSVQGNTPAVGLDESGNPVAVWFEADAGTDRHLMAATGDATAPELRGLSVPTSGVAGEALTFSVSPFDLWSGLDTTTWSFGDGATATGTSVGHTYANPGTYTVTVLSTDTAGHVTDTTRTVTIAAAPAPPESDDDRPKQTLAPVLEARLSGRTIAINAKVSTRSGKRCSGSVAAKTAFGGRTYRTTLKLKTVSGKCRAQGTIKLRKTPSLRSKLRITISGKPIKTRTLTTKRG